MDERLAWVVSNAMQSDPSLEHDVAQEMAARALYLVEQQSEADAAGVARVLMQDFSEYGASTASVVARAAFEFVTGPQP
ncbi:MAG: hypothetical protein JWN31_579 [Frankiales bacterium]|nr:hypothetical protein [Frankiales bacterium]